MTTYTMNLGYRSSGGRLAAQAQLQGIVEDLRLHHKRIADEVRRVEAQYAIDPYVDEFAAQYHPDIQDKTISVEVDDKNTDVLIVQNASGPGPQRALKEACRRAFCRLVIEAMHRGGFEVNITVT